MFDNKKYETVYLRFPKTQFRFDFLNYSLLICSQEGALVTLIFLSRGFEARHEYWPSSSILKFVKFSSCRTTPSHVTWELETALGREVKSMGFCSKSHDTFGSGTPTGAMHESDTILPSTPSIRGEGTARNFSPKPEIKKKVIDSVVSKIRKEIYFKKLGCNYSFWI